MKNVDIIGACSDLGLHIDGSNKGPLQLISKIDIKDNISNIKKIFPDINYKKELDKNNKRKNLKQINRFNSNLYDLVISSLNQNNFPIVLGGDHSISIASSLASIKKHDNLGIIWFDAHGDFNTFETTPSGNIHGLPFAALTNYEKKYLTDFHDGNYYKYNNCVLVGARDIDEPYELQNFKNAGITIFTKADIDKYGADVIYEKAFKIASNNTNGIHISFDIDALDPDIAPGVSVPVLNGINLEDSNKFIDYIIKNKDIIKSFDLVEFNPENDINKKTEKIAINILNKIIKNL